MHLHQRVVCHGIPSEDEILKEGDIVNVDCSTIKDGYYSDSSRMFIIGETTSEKADLVRVQRGGRRGLESREALGASGRCGRGRERIRESARLRWFARFGGHGIGLEFHEDPFVSFVTEPGEGPISAPVSCSPSSR